MRVEANGRFAAMSQDCIRTSDGSCRTGAYRPMSITASSVNDTPNLGRHTASLVLLPCKTSNNGTYSL